MNRQSFLLLQGVATPFFSELGDALTKDGHIVLRVNFCGGDWLSGKNFSTRLSHIHYQDKPEALDAFYTKIFKQYQVSDIVLFGDTRPIHQTAIAIATEQNITIHAYEEGYFRNSWVSLEKGGVNANSTLSNDPKWYLDFVQKNPAVLTKPKPNIRSVGKLSIRAWHDFRYHFANLLFKTKFPYYETHRPERAAKEYWGWIQRMPALKFYYNKKSAHQINELMASHKPYYLLPLQLDADSQIRIHSPIKSITDVILTTLKSFAAHAPKDAIIVIKLHPLDPWFIDYPAVIRETAKAYDIDEKRILYLEAGDLLTLLQKAKGTILVNSTVGTLSLAKNCPVIALGSAIYDMPGLTFQGELDEFWMSATPPNQALFKAFSATLVELTQINGNFYSEEGIKKVVKNSMKHLVNSYTTN